MERLTIIGAGTMGHSIALNAAWKNISVSLCATDGPDAQRAHDGIHRKLVVLSENGMLPQNDAGEILSRIRIVTDVDQAIAGATYIIEAIPEDIELKRKLFQYLDQRCDPGVILASTTSGLSISAIASGLQHPARVLIAHFWNPAHLIPLVEVLGTAATGHSVMDRTAGLLSDMDKKPVFLTREVPGLVGNRLQFALLREALYLLESGAASLEDIDNVVKYGIARRLPVTGPIMSADLAGLDVFAAISAYLFPDLDNSGKTPSSLAGMIDAGKLGQKTGAGYYDWPADRITELSRQREEELIRFLKQDKKKNSSL